MSRLQKDPMRKLTADERSWLERVSRSQSEPAAHVARAKMLLAVAEGKRHTDAARLAGRRSNDAVSHLVSRFNAEGLAALEPRHGGGPDITYGATERARILAEFRRTPERATDGSASWSLSLLQRALRQAPAGLPTVSIDTIWRFLTEAGVSWQRDRAWCATGQALRQRKSGTVIVTDPDSEAKQS